ncbi:hypothetical protein BDW69DRAFT_190388 [Aspergillus filifer]
MLCSTQCSGISGTIVKELLNIIEGGNDAAADVEYLEGIKQRFDALIAELEGYDLEPPYTHADTNLINSLLSTCFDVSDCLDSLIQDVKKQKEQIPRSISQLAKFKKGFRNRLKRSKRNKLLAKVELCAAVTHRVLDGIDRTALSGRLASIERNSTSADQRLVTLDTSIETLRATEKYFFSKDGAPVQNTWNQFVRGLLYFIISECPDIIPLLFKDQYEDVKAGSHVFFDADYEIYQAFQKLIDCPEVYKNRKFAIFIDGIDCFNGNCDHLTSQLQGWVEMRPGDVRVCIAGLNNSINRAFESSPYMQMHQHTCHGVSRITRDTLIRNNNFCKLTDASEEATTNEGVSNGNPTSYGERIIKAVVDCSQGILLWVARVLPEFDQRLNDFKTMGELEEADRGLESLEEVYAM